MRITDESAFFNSMPETTTSPMKGAKQRDGLPPAHKGPGGGGGRGGAGAGGPSGPERFPTAGQQRAGKIQIIII